MMKSRFLNSRLNTTDALNNISNQIGTTNEILTTADSRTKLDAFGRLRVSEPFTLFDSKLLYDKQPLFWDEELVSGSAITSTFDIDSASTDILSTVNTAGNFVRQTFRRFNYQSGKSFLVFATGILTDTTVGTHTCRIGYFDDDNGLFFEYSINSLKVVIRSSTTGSAVNNKILQSAWNLDKMDGTGDSGIDIDITKTQIFVINFEWLGVGSVYHLVSSRRPQ
jgi:hypothetical protein